MCVYICLHTHIYICLENHKCVCNIRYMHLISARQPKKMKWKTDIADNVPGEKRNWKKLLQLPVQIPLFLWEKSAAIRPAYLSGTYFNCMWSPALLHFVPRGRLLLLPLLVLLVVVIIIIKQLMIFSHKFKCAKICLLWFIFMSLHPSSVYQQTRKKPFNPVFTMLLQFRI